MLPQIKRTIRAALKRRGFDLVRTDPPLRKKLSAETIQGWFDPAECRKLYLLTAMTSGPILEIGHFLGRTTACICEAIKDTRKPRLFRSYDLGFRSAEEFQAFYHKIFNSDIPVPKQFEDVFSKNTTTTDMAIQNLKLANLAEYATLISGNAFELDADKYDMIFCDAMHSAEEISANIGHIVARSNHACVWAFHDMHPANIELVLSLADAEYVDLTASLGVFIYMATEHQNRSK